MRHRINTYRNAIESKDENGKLIWIQVPKKKKPCVQNRKHEGNIDDIRKAIFERDNNKCFYCGNTSDLQLDHVMPKHTYEWHDVYNLITSCRKCNFRKSNSILLDPLLGDVLTYLAKANKKFNEETKKLYKIRLELYYGLKK